MDVRLMATDLDGTLLSSDKKLGERNRAALARAAEKGIEVVPATGRAGSSIPPQVRELPFVRYLLTTCGARVYDRQEEQTIFQAELSCEEALAITRYLRGEDVYFDIYKDDQGYAEQSYYDRMGEYAAVYSLEVIRASRKPVPDLEALLQGDGGVQKINLFFKDQEQRWHIWRELERRFPTAEVACSLPRNAEVYTARAGKGNALKALCAHLGIEMSQLLVFGDSSNDLSMLKVAGVSVVMGNAEEEVKSAAHYITRSNDEEGVAEFLERYVL